MNKNLHAGIIAMASTAFLWSLAGLFIKMIDWHPVTIAGMRSLIAAIVILIVLKRPKITFSAPQIGATIANAATMLLFVSANKTTTAANAILLQYFAPVITAFIGAALLKERIHKEYYFALPLVIVGLAIMFFDELGGGRLFGNVMALLSAFTFSAFFICLRIQKEGSPLESVLLSHLFTALICLIASFFLPIPHFTRTSIIAITALGVVQIGIPAILLSFAIKRITAVQATLIAVIEPVFNPVWVFVILGEIPGVTTLLGGCIIICAVTFASVAGTQRSVAPAMQNRGNA